MHELMHWEHVNEIGYTDYKKLTDLEREQEVYDRLRSPANWAMLSGEERAHARFYIKKLGGDAW
jgi:hypothetical protein